MKFLNIIRVVIIQYCVPDTKLGVSYLLSLIFILHYIGIYPPYNWETGT